MRSHQNDQTERDKETTLVLERYAPESLQCHKAALAREVLLADPTYGEIFEIYTDALKRQLGTVITQNNRPIAFFSRKLSKTNEVLSHGT